MPPILDFQIQPLSAESYSVTVCERGSAQPLAAATFSHRVDFLTDFSVDRLNATTKDPAERFDELQKLGRELYQKLFPPAVEQVWQTYKQRSEFLTLCLRFAVGATKLEVLPWEMLHDGAEFIAAGAKTTLTRLPLDVTPPSALPPIPQPLKLFGFFASPLDLQDHERLNAEREQEILLEAINDPAAAGRISADFEDEAKLEILERSLRDGYHILHFTGHGISPRDGGGLLLEDAHGKKLPASIADVMQAVERGQDGKAKLRLAVISGCQTARTLHAQGFNDLARELLRQRVPAVIAMQFSISDEGGLKFAESLYREIAKGVALERAVHTARRVLLEDNRFFINNDALAIVLLAADGACLQTTAAETEPPQAEASATYLGDRLDPLAHGFYGRRREYRKIRDALLHQNQCAVIIHGIGGIGKTALLTHAINRLRPRFKDVMSFDCRRAALAPETILLELHRYFATQGMPQLQPLIGQNVPPETLAEEIAQVLMLLTERPLLIVFDNFESQLDERREFINQDLCIFLTRLLRVTAKGSRFLFTTRYLFDLDGEQPSYLLHLPLADLSRAEALMLMQKLPNLAQAAHRDKLAVLEKFGGHPYALVALDRLCCNQLLNQALQDASLLKSDLREHLAIELNYQRLSERAHELLHRLAAFRQIVPIAAAVWVMGEKAALIAGQLQILRGELSEELKASGYDTLRQMLGTAPKQQQEIDISEVIPELINWGVLTPHYESDVLQALSVHGLVRDFCCDQHNRVSWGEQLRQAATFYLDQTKLPTKNLKTQQDVWAEIEAFELLMEAEDFFFSAHLLADATQVLTRLGFMRYLDAQYRRLMDKLDGRNAAVILHNHATQLKAFGEYDAALRQYQKALEILKGLDDGAGVARTLNQIGIIHQLRNEYDVARQHYQQSLEIEIELDDRAGMTISLHQIGTIHQARAEYEQALQYYQQSLEAAKELNDRESLASALKRIGMVYQARGEFEAALHHYQQSLDIEIKLDDRSGIASSLHQIAMIHYLRGEYEVALQQFQDALKIKEELGDRAGISASLHQIAMIYQASGNHEEALDYYQRALKIAEELKDHMGIASTRGQIGSLQFLLGNSEAAQQQYQQAFEMAEELGDRWGMARFLHNIGNIYYSRGDRKIALPYYQQSLAIKEELGDPEGVASSRVMLGGILAELGNCQEAFNHMLSALVICVELQSPKVQPTAISLKTLRNKWGGSNFDTAWREATSQAVPDWLK